MGSLCHEAAHLRTHDNAAMTICKTDDIDFGLARLKCMRRQLRRCSMGGMEVRPRRLIMHA